MLKTALIFLAVLERINKWKLSSCYDIINFIKRIYLN